MLENSGRDIFHFVLSLSVSKSPSLYNYFSRSSKAESSPAQPKKSTSTTDNIYEAALKRKCANVSDESGMRPPATNNVENSDSVEFKKLKLEIVESRAKIDKYKKTQNQMLKMLHDYRLKVLRLEKSQTQPENSPKKFVPIPLLDDEISEVQKREYFTDSELVQLNSIPNRKVNDREFCRKLFEFLYRGNLNVLSTRTLTPNPSKGKQCITPKKVEILTKMMVTRGKSANDEIEILERITPNYIKRILSDALGAVKRKHAVAEPSNN